MARDRETVNSRLGFIMLAAGSAIGLGNVWRFPYMTGSHGGGVFVLFYLLFLLLLGFPVMTGAAMHSGATWGRPWRSTRDGP